MGTATVIGISAAPATAGAAPVNLIQNGSFETTNVPVPSDGYLTVDAGDSTTIPDWTVVTPASYIAAGNSPTAGSVDVVSSGYNNWGCEDGNNCIDLAGTTDAPGGLVQAVTTTPGVEYSLSFWSAVNGDENTEDGVTHTLGVTVNGSTIDTVQAVAAGTPLQWVPNTVTFTATSNSSTIEFDDDTSPFDQNQGPTLDNVSLTAMPDTISANPVPIAPQTVGVGVTAPVATFTDSYGTPPLSNFAATISWGNGSTSPGKISQSGGTYTVSGDGTYSYATAGTYTVGVNITSTTGGSASTSEPGVSVANAVTTCTGSGCSGTASNSLQTVQISSTSTSGTILTDINPTSTAPNCGDPFRHAPQVVTFSDTGLNANIVYTVTFANKSAAGFWLVPFAVCYQAQTPFKNLFGKTVTTGLLPQCTLIPRPNQPLVAPCVESITELPHYLGNVVEKILVPPGDPKIY